MHNLTKKQKEILDFIQEFSDKQSVAPSYREIQAHFKLASLSSVFQHIQALKKKGCIDLQKHTPRSIQFTHEKAPLANFIEVPFIGHLKVGYPLETFAKIETIPLPASWIRFPDQTYLLKVVGNGLFEEQMAPGDFLLIEARQEIANGEMALVLINEHDMLLKRYFLEDEYIRLEATNPSFRPMIVRKENVLLQGVLKRQFRVYDSPENC